MNNPGQLHFKLRGATIRRLSARVKTLTQSNRRLREVLTSIREVAAIQRLTCQPESILHRMFNSMVEDIDAALKDSALGEDGGAS